MASWPSSRTASRASSIRVRSSGVSMSLGWPSVRMSSSFFRLARAQVVAGVAQGRAHARGVTRLDARQAALHLVVKTFVKTLDVLVAHIVPGVGVKARDGEGIAQLLNRPGQQGDGFAAEVEHGLLTPRRGFVQ